MLGIITAEEDAYVKAAIVKLIRIRDLSEDQESDVNGEKEIETESVTYVETDAEGRFVIQELDPKEKYIIEILVEKPEPEAAKEVQASAAAVPDPYNDPDDSELDDEDEITDKNFIIDSLKTNSEINYTISENMSVKNTNEMSNLNEKTYLKKCNLW